MNWQAFLITLLPCGNVVGFIVLFYNFIDYCTWENRGWHRTQRNLVITGSLFFVIELAVFVGAIA